jgi:hypothetical protein
VSELISYDMKRWLRLKGICLHGCNVALIRFSTSQYQEVSKKNIYFALQQKNLFSLPSSLCLKGTSDTKAFRCGFVAYSMGLRLYQRSPQPNENSFTNSLSLVVDEVPILDFSFSVLLIVL